jgi:hypothetical protein
VTVLCAVVQSGRSFDEHVFHFRKLRDLRFCRRIAAQLISDDHARHGIRAQHPLEETFGRGLVAPLLHQDVEFGAMLVDRTPQQVGFAAQRNEHLVKVPRAARIASRRFYAVSKALAKFVAPASDRLVCHGHTALEEQFLDVAQAQLKAEIPAHSATDYLGWETMTVIERFRFLHRAILRHRPNNLTTPLWRAVDQHGAELDILLQKRRDKAAAKRFFKRVLASCTEAPRKIVTDQLRSYPAAKAEIPELAHLKHVFVKASARVNNRAENSPQPTRERERRMRGFRDLERTQAFLSSFGPIRQHFALKRHLLRASPYRKQLAARFAAWHRFTEATQDPSVF